jgi:hypothetical protein
MPKNDMRNAMGITKMKYAPVLQSFNNLFYEVVIFPFRVFFSSYFVCAMKSLVNCC